MQLRLDNINVNGIQYYKNYMNIINSLQYWNSCPNNGQKF